MPAVKAAAFAANFSKEEPALRVSEILLKGIAR